MVLTEANIFLKLANIERAVFDTLERRFEGIPKVPSRDVQVLRLEELPPKKGLSYIEGQARLLHDLASIELQAMELGLRSLIEFPDAPEAFRQELLELTLGEGRHLRMCLEGLEDLKMPWGSFPVHIALWEAVRSEDSLLDRVLIVHRYLEGSGLDAGQNILKRLNGARNQKVSPIVETIVREEVDHVRFGSRWYREICWESGLDAEQDFSLRLTALRGQLPRRMEAIAYDLRLQAGFKESEIVALERFRQGGSR